MSVQPLLDFERKANDYLNVRCNKLIVDDEIEVLGTTPRFALSKQILAVASITTSPYVFEGSNYQDYAYSYDSGDLLLAADGRIALPKGVYFVSATIVLSCVSGGSNEASFSLKEYVSGADLISAVEQQISTEASSLTLTGIVNIIDDIDVIFKLFISNTANAVQITTDDRSSLFSIYRLL